MYNLEDILGICKADFRASAEALKSAKFQHSVAKKRLQAVMLTVNLAEEIEENWLPEPEVKKPE